MEVTTSRHQQLQKLRCACQREHTSRGEGRLFAAVRATLEADERGRERSEFLGPLKGSGGWRECLA
jgi:hypothetical protein